MRPSTLRPSIMTPEGLALLQREVIEASPAAKAKARPTALAAGSYGASRCCGVTVLARSSAGSLTTILLLVEGSNRAEVHAGMLRQLMGRGLRLHAVKDYGDAAG